MKNIYWGWFVVGGAFLNLVLIYGARYSFGVFLKPMFHEYHWPMTIISLGVSINLAVYAGVGILTGRLLDRIAPKWILTVGALLTASGFVLAGHIKTPVGFYISYGLLAGAGSAGCGAVVTSASVGKWFARKKGLAIGISSMGMGVGTIIMAPLANHVIMHFGWRTGFLFIAALIFLVGILIAQMIMGKMGPQEMGLLPDGDAPGNGGSSLEEGANDEETISILSVLKSDRFRILAICNMLAALVVMMVFVHQIAYAVDRGIDEMQAAAAVGIIGIAGSLGKFFFGWLSDRLRDAKYSAALGYFLMGVGLFVLNCTQTAPDLYLFAIIYGFGYGSMAPMMPYLISDRFGRRALGGAYGWLNFFVTGVGGSLGPVLGGYIYDQTGTYTMGWLIGIILLLISTILILSLKLGAPEPNNLIVELSHHEVLGRSKNVP